jgi:hypothetical protein
MKKCMEGEKIRDWRCSNLRSNQQVDGVSCDAYVMFAMTLLSFGNYTTMSHHFTPGMIDPMRCYVFNSIINREIHVLNHARPKCKHWYNCNDGDMVACDSCNLWTHLACTHYSSLREANLSDYVRSVCSED